MTTTTATKPEPTATKATAKKSTGKSTAKKAAPAKKATAKKAPAIPTWTPKGDDAKHRCSGACGKTLPMKKFPTISGRPGIRGGECRACRDARSKAAKAAKAGS